MENMLDEYEAAYSQEPETKQWLGLIVNRSTKLVETVGIEFSEAAIRDWCELTLVSWPLYGIEAPDAYDRRS